MSLYHIAFFYLELAQPKGWYERIDFDAFKGEKTFTGRTIKSGPVRLDRMELLAPEDTLVAQLLAGSIDLGLLESVPWLLFSPVSHAKFSDLAPPLIIKPGERVSVTLVRESDQA